jgi:membrane protein YdbS with pleckstrin-like domain
MNQEGPPPAIAPESADALPDLTDEPVEAALREPAHQVSPRAVAFWRTSALVGYALQLGLAGTAYYFADEVFGERPWWAAALLALVAALGLVRVVWMPQLRYRIHRWEITPTAVFTRSGWLSREQRIAPLSRVQTVDSHQGAVMRLFKLSSITVTTASAAGPVRIDCLDQDVARRVVAELTEITGSAEGDAT